MKMEALKVFVVVPLICVGAIGHIVTPIHKDHNLGRCLKTVLNARALICATYDKQVNMLKLFNVDYEYPASIEEEEESEDSLLPQDFRQYFKRNERYVRDIRDCCFRPCTMRDILRTC